LHKLTLSGSLASTPVPFIQGEPILDGDTRDADDTLHATFNFSCQQGPPACVGLLVYALTWPDGQPLQHARYLIVAWRVEGIQETREFAVYLLGQPHASSSLPSISEDTEDNGNSPESSSAWSLLHNLTHADTDTLPDTESVLSQVFQWVSQTGMVPAGQVSVQQYTIEVMKRSLNLVLQSDLSSRGPCRLALMVHNRNLDKEQK
jgi:hypothetical protein